MNLPLLCASAAVLTAFALPTLGAEAPMTPEIVIEKDGSVTMVKTGGAGWAGVIENIQKLRELAPDQDAQVIDVLQKNMDALPPAYIYELARRTCTTDPDRAVYLFNLAGLRARYDVFRCVDETAQAGIEATITSLPMPQCSALADERKSAAALEKLRKSKELFASTASPWWICSHGMQAVMAGLNGQSLETSQWEKPQSEWDAVKRDVSAMIENALNSQARSKD